MKNIISLIIIALVTTTAFAKKVKFAVDMTNETVSPNGVHVTGDFQVLAGYPGDWESGTTTLTQEGSTNIYSIVVEIPAFAKYEYKFVNGDQFYEAEFVPSESRVGYNFNDNRWLYVDSLANDTTFIGALIFAGNAPAGLTLVRFLVNMQNEIVSSNGVHVAGDFQGWNTQNNILYSFASNIYEAIAYVNTGSIQYKFYNGNNSSNAEVIPGICSVNSNRELTVSADIVLNEVCFGSCTACVVGFNEMNAKGIIQLYPNPSASFSTLSIHDDNSFHTIQITDMTGRLIKAFHRYQQKTLLIDNSMVQNGVYFVTVKNEMHESSVLKLIIE